MAKTASQLANEIKDHEAAEKAARDAKEAASLTFGGLTARINADGLLQISSRGPHMGGTLSVEEAAQLRNKLNEWFPA